LSAEPPRGRGKLRAQRGEKAGGDCDWLECDENMGDYSADSYYCQELLFMGTVRTTLAEVERFEGIGGIETTEVKKDARVCLLLSGYRIRARARTRWLICP